jgi:hypothetical protein
LERLEKIEAHLRLWGLEKLTPTGVMEWTNDVQWLMEQALKAKRYEIALQMIMKDGELFNTTTKKTTYSYPGKVAKKALEG